MRHAVDGAHQPGFGVEADLQVVDLEQGHGVLGLSSAGRGAGARMP
jgi:hypothetical protein